MEYGAISLIPPLVMLIFALKTKKSFEALIIGTIVGYIIMYGTDFLQPWCEMLLEECGNRDNLYILLLCGMFGGLIFLLREVKGTTGVSSYISRYCKTERSVNITAMIMGIIIFVDDYLNVMTVGSCMKELYNKLRIPRQVLAYIIDSTGAPVCAILPFSTWVVFYSGMFAQEQTLLDMGFSTGFDVYYSAVPYMLYPFAALLVVFLFSMGWLPKIGPMKEAYSALRTDNAKPNSIDTSLGAMGVNMEGAGVMNVRQVSPAVDPIDVKSSSESGNLLDFILPMSVLIILTVLTSDMLLAMICTLASCMALYIPRKKMTFTRFVELFWEGFSDILPVLGILLACFMTKRVSADMCMPEYVISLTQPLMSPELMAAVTFVVIAILTFVTSSFWGIEAIAISIVVPLATAVGSDVMLVLGAVISGGVFGSHACFYADATVLSSATCDIDNFSHAMTQLPYALLSAVLATLGFVAAGYIF